MLSIFAPLVLAAAPATAAPDVPATLPPKPRRQQQFDAASMAMAEGRCDEAVKQFEALETTRAATADPTVSAVIAVRKGYCLAMLDRADEAEPALQSGLAVLQPQADRFKDDIHDGRLALGRLAFFRFDYATAQQEVERALAVTTGRARLDLLLMLVRITMFDPGTQPLDLADEAVAIATQGTPQDKNAIAVARTARARVLLNQGRNKEAYAELKTALQLQGGLGLKVTLSEIVTRSDLALAALLNGDDENARKYLAYTGAGRTKESPFARAAAMETPLCAGDVGLKPDESAIIEFHLRDDGSVSSAVPIYSAAGRQAALAFAKAVSQWSWRPEDAVAIPQFFRYAIRVELRCSTVGQRPGVLSVLRGDFDHWLAAQGVHPPGADGGDTKGDAKMAVAARADLARLAGPADDLRRLAMLVALGRNPVVPPEQSARDLDDAAGLARLARAPVAARTYIDLLVLDAKAERSKARRGAGTAMRGLLLDPAVAADAHAAGTVRLLVATPDYRSPAPVDADALLAAVAGDDRLASDDPLKVNALLQQASRAAAAGRLDAARATFARTGLSEEQCALVGSAPALKHAGGSSSDFPSEAMAWGFEGWVRVEFDILADGRTSRQRATVAYPPFVFSEAAADISKVWRYQSTYRPSGGGATCTGGQRQLIFKLP